MIAQQAGRLVTVVHAEFPARAVAIGVDRRFRHAELACDLLRTEMLVHEAQAFAFALREQLHRVLRDDRTRRHGALS